MMMVTAHTALERLWSLAECDRRALERIEFDGEEPVLPSVSAIGTAADACIAAAGLAASELWRVRTGLAQPVRIAMRHAGIACRSVCLDVTREWRPSGRSGTRAPPPEMEHQG